MNTKRNSSAFSGIGPGNYLNGTIRVDFLFKDAGLAHQSRKLVPLTQRTIAKAPDGKVVDWMKKVSDEQYCEDIRTA